jgi:hypothetical protein
MSPAMVLVRCVLGVCAALAGVVWCALGAWDTIPAADMGVRIVCTLVAYAIAAPAAEDVARLRDFVDTEDGK